MPTPNEVLKQYWGYDQLRPAQETAINHILDHQDVITLLPTGGGKSICFQIPSLMREGTCLVISPLISLMQDQVSALKRRGIKAMMLGGTIPFNELNTLLDNCQYGNYKFLYISPERLQNELIQSRLQLMNINLVAIDEAHCISEWGHDFRPAYRKIEVLKELLPDVNFIALTATATQKVLDDIRENLGLQKPKIVKISFERNNISILIKKEEDKNYQLQNFLKKNPGVAIVYVRSRQLTLNLSKLLESHHISAAAYHGGLNTAQKEQLLQDWQAERFKVMVATNAFGMGIDKANVRNVIHFNLPDSLESYYQEIGRAGRDGLPSKAFLIYDEGDILKLKNQFLDNSPTVESVKFIYKKLNSYFSIAYGEGQEKLYNFNFLDFCNTYQLNTYLAYNVLQFLDQLDIISLSREFHQRTELYFKISHRALSVFLEKNLIYRAFIESLLRMKGGFFNYKTTINLKVLQNKTGLSRQRINTILEKLAELDVIDLTLADQDSTVQFLVPREDNRTISPVVPYIKQHYKNKKYKIERIINFIEDDETCKVIKLLAYFDEKKEVDCGQCSVCIERNRPKKQSKSELLKIRKAIKQELIKHDKMSSKEIASQLDFREESILFVLQKMLDFGEIKKGHGNSYFLTPNS